MVENKPLPNIVRERAGKGLVIRPTIFIPFFLQKMFFIIFKSNVLNLKVFYL